MVGIMIALIAGIISNTIAGNLNPYLIKSLSVNSNLYSFTLAPIVEETSKLAMLVLLLRLMIRPGRNTIEGVTSFSPGQMGMATGSFFMLFERLLKAGSGGFSFPTSIIDLSPTHPVATGVSASSLRSDMSAKKLGYLLPLAIIVHASYNYISYIAVALNNTFISWTIFAIFWVAFFLMARYLNPRKNADTL
jgi:RsiW-degrading membrane proteinase PrsW (M82 family)